MDRHEAGRSDATSQAHRLAHAKKANHLARHRSDPLQIVLCTGGYVVENHFFGRASAQRAADAIQQLGARHQELVFGRQLQGVSKRGSPPWDDADLMDRVRMFAVGGDQRVTDLMIRYAALQFFGQTPAFALRARHDLFHRLL